MLPDDEEKMLEKEFSVFVCQSQSTVINVYCGVFVLFNVVQTVSAFSVASTKGINYTATQGNNKTIIVNEEFWPAVAWALGCMYFLQAALLVATVVMVRRRYFQERWRWVSTLAIVVASLIGPVPFVALQNFFIVGTDIANLVVATPNNNAIASDFNLRAVALDTLVLSVNQRNSGLSALGLLAFAPRFREFSAVCCLLAACELVSEMCQLAQWFAAVASTNRGILFGRFKWEIFVTPAFCVVIACVPVLVPFVRSDRARGCCCV